MNFDVVSMSTGPPSFSPPFLAPKQERLKGKWLCSQHRNGRLVTAMSFETPVQYGSIQHAGLLVENTEVAKEFYMTVLGMEDDTKVRNPRLPFRGAFLKAGTCQIHLMELPSLDPKEGRPDHGGRDKHIAITVKSLEPLIASLKKNNRYFTASKSGRRAIFTRDLDANALEFIEDPSVF